MDVDSLLLTKMIIRESGSGPSAGPRRKFGVSVSKPPSDTSVYLTALMRMLLTLIAIGAVFYQPPHLSPIQDGEAHGDPPYVLEEGWEPLLNGKDLAGWKACEANAKNEWYTTRFVMFERLLGPTRLSGRAAPSGVMLNGQTGRTANLCSERTFGDVELYLEFMLAKGSNSGVYLQGLYEIQIFDSWGSTEGVKTSDAGAIYHRWIDEQGVHPFPRPENPYRQKADA